jgi:hypothetical protein
MYDLKFSRILSIVNSMFTGYLPLIPLEEVLEILSFLVPQVEWVGSGVITEIHRELSSQIV